LALDGKGELKMKSYIKTQWWRLLIALLCFVMACLYAFRPAGDTTTLEGLNYDLGNAISAVINFSSFIIWSFSSFIDWHTDCICELEKRIEDLENYTITDIDKVSENNYMVRRRLGPDKDVPYPDEEESKDGN
jgi:hypothetical protein